MGSREIKTEVEIFLSGPLFYLISFSLPSSSVNHTHHFRPKTSAHTSLLLFYEFLLV